MKIDLIIEGLDRLLIDNFYNEKTIKSYHYFWNRLKRYLIDKYQSDDYDPSKGLEFLSEKYNLSVKCDNKTLKQSEVQYFRMIHLLDDYMLHGVLTRRFVSTKNPITLEGNFAETYVRFEEYIKSLDLSNSTIKHYTCMAKVFMDYLRQKGLSDLSDINVDIVRSFICTFIQYSYKTVEQNICGLRFFLRFINNYGILDNDIAKTITMPKKSKKASLPSVWKADELKAILAQIDRNSPIGKRDYAMILLASILGIRIGDIKNLRFSNIDWNEKKISIIQSKTKKPLTLPIPKPLGWALIDYIKNGRPNYYDDDHVFIKHMPPFDYYKDDNHMGRIIGKYCNKAGIYTGSNHKKGFHSLRHTAASMLLDEGVQLPVITEILGHSNVDITAVYLKTDLKHLKECVLNLNFEDSYETV